MEDRGLDCLLLHSPKFDNWYKPLGEFLWINYLPMGMLALADYLVQRGYSTRIVHLGIEWIEDNGFDLLDLVTRYNPDVIGLSLHWHHQAYDTIQIVEALKKFRPRTCVVLGGFTASYYHREILDNFSSVDCIIRGEGEIPLLELVKKVVSEEGNFAGVPNLSWRNNGKVVVNNLTYVASEDDMNQMNFTNISLLNNYQTYVDYVGHPFLWKKNISKEKNFKNLSIRSKTFPLTLGRGCPANCTWCSGSLISQEFITGRKKPVYRSIEKIMESIREAVSYGYETMYVVFDPFPGKPDFFLDLFARIRDEKLDFEMIFECHGLPEKVFVNAFHETFPHKASFLCLSPETGDERVRKMHKGHYYSNRELLECLAFLRESEVAAEVFFTYGIPGESLKSLRETISLKSLIKKKFKNVGCIRVLSIEMEPGAPWHLHPERYGIVNERTMFLDFYRAHASRYNQTFSSLGYFIPDYFPGKPQFNNTHAFEDELQKIKCKHFCFLGPDPRKSGPAWMGRAFCHLLYMVEGFKSKGSARKRVPVIPMDEAGKRS